jgi:uncharacterized repeat protein (TIGR03803 family)
MLKKIYPLPTTALCLVLLCSSITHAQDKLWGVGVNVFHMNTDGTDYVEATGDSSAFLFRYITLGDDGSIYGCTSDAISKFGPAGVHTLLTLPDYLIPDLFIDGGNGFLYGIGRGSFGFGHVVYRVRYDGTDFHYTDVSTYGFLPASLTRTHDGNLYGVSSGGGANKKGFIFRIRPDASGIDIIYNFAKPEGIAPMGKLLEGHDGYLYGTARRGGAHSFGVIYKISQTGQYTKLFEFDGNNGRWPSGDLVQDEDGYLYGTTSSREKFRNGIVFRIKPDGTELTRLYEFAEGAGNTPDGPLLLGNDGLLYGNAPSGGPPHLLRGFKVAKDGSGFQLLPGAISFYQPADGQATVQVVDPADGTADVAANGLNVFTNEIGGALTYTLQLSETPGFETPLTYHDTVNAFQVSGLSYSTQYYARVKTNTWPTYGAVTTFTTADSIVEAAPVLWGIEQSTFDYLIGSGTAAMHMNTDGGDFKYAFWGGYDNAVQSVAFIAPGPHSVYAILKQSPATGGVGGSILKLDANRITRILNFPDNKSNGATLVDAGNGYMYGAGCAAGCSGVNIFRFSYDGNTYEEKRIVLYGFGTQGAVNSTADHQVFGMSSGGGAHNRGFIYRIRPDVSGIDIIHSFAGADGKAPDTKLLEGSDGSLYGITTTGGVFNNGVIFKVDKDGQHYQKLYEFSVSKAAGVNPIGTLVQDADDILYGVCKGSGSFKKGMIFRINPDGSGFTSLYSFDGVTATDPDGNLLLDEDGNLYGVAGKKYFSIRTDGTSFTVLREGAQDVNKLSFLMTEPVVPETYVTSPANGSNQAYSFFAAGITYMDLALDYDIQVSRNANFTDIEFAGTTGDHATIYSTPFINVFGLDFNTTYYARVRSSLWPYFGPVTQFNVPSKTVRLWGNFTFGDRENTCYGYGGGTVFSVALDGSGFMRNLEYPCVTELGARDMNEIKLGNNNSLFGFSIGVDVVGGGELFTIDATGHFSTLRTFTDRDIMSAIQGEDNDYYLMTLNEIFDPTFSLIKVSAADTSLTTLHVFTPEEGEVSADMVVPASDGFVYGLTAGDSLSSGLIYKVKTDGSNYGIVKNFDEVTGERPIFILDGKDGYVYGLTEKEDLTDGGTLFRISTSGVFEPLQTFINSIGVGAQKLIHGNDGYIYGTTHSGGATNAGTLYRVATITGDYETLYNFQTPAGDEPDDFLILNDTIYGTAHGDVFEAGNMKAIFRINKDGTDFRYIFQFTGELGSGSAIVVAYDNGYLYGKSSEDPTAFRLRTDGTDLIIYDLWEQSGWLASPLPNVFPYPKSPSLFNTRKYVQAIAGDKTPENIVSKNLPVIMPNPFNKGFTIYVNENSRAVVTDVSGRVMAQTASFAGSVELGENLPAGLYLVRVTEGNRTSIHRVIKK